mmetsp:Transcript_15824/g.37820  ORF Transcript_15824/g.37820 Transcript_15824/m.37820 type:complete len:239 (-) Transcript_15824:6885-7601(-)
MRHYIHASEGLQSWNEDTVFHPVPFFARHQEPIPKACTYLLWSLWDDGEVTAQWGVRVTGPRITPGRIRQKAVSSALSNRLVGKRKSIRVQSRIESVRARRGNVLIQRRHSGFAPVSKCDRDKTVRKPEPQLVNRVCMLAYDRLAPWVEEVASLIATRLITWRTVGGSCLPEPVVALHGSALPKHENGVGTTRWVEYDGVRWSHQLSTLHLHASTTTEFYLTRFQVLVCNAARSHEAV